MNNIANFAKMEIRIRQMIAQLTAYKRYAEHAVILNTPKEKYALKMKRHK